MLVDVSDIFNVFFARRRGRGVRGAKKGGVGFFIENPREGGGLLGQRGRGPKGRECVYGKFEGGGG